MVSEEIHRDKDYVRQNNGVANISLDKKESEMLGLTIGSEFVKILMKGKHGLFLAIFNPKFQKKQMNKKRLLE